MSVVDQLKARLNSPDRWWEANTLFISDHHLFHPSSGGRRGDLLRFIWQLGGELINAPGAKLGAEMFNARKRGGKIYGVGDIVDGLFLHNSETRQQPTEPDKRYFDAFLVHACDPGTEVWLLEGNHDWRFGELADLLGVDENGKPNPLRIPHPHDPNVVAQIFFARETTIQDPKDRTIAVFHGHQYQGSQHSMGGGNQIQEALIHGFYEGILRFNDSTRQILRAFGLSANDALHWQPLKKFVKTLEKTKTVKRFLEDAKQYVLDTDFYGVLNGHIHFKYDKKAKGDQKTGRIFGIGDGIINFSYAVIGDKSLKVNNWLKKRQKMPVYSDFPSINDENPNKFIRPLTDSLLDLFLDMYPSQAERKQQGPSDFLAITGNAMAVSSMAQLLEQHQNLWYGTVTAHAP